MNPADRQLCRRYLGRAASAANRGKRKDTGPAITMALLETLHELSVAVRVIVNRTKEERAERHRKARVRTVRRTLAALAREDSK